MHRERELLDMEKDWEAPKIVMVGSVFLLVALIVIWFASEVGANASSSFSHSSDSWGASEAPKSGH